MAIVTVKSANITNLETSPISVLDKKGGKLICQIDQIEVATTSMDDVGDIILIGALPSNAILVDLKFMNDALAASGLAYNIGGYYSGIGSGQIAGGKTSGTVIDADNIGTAVAFSTARIVPTSFRFEVDDIANINKELWSVLGLASDPGGLIYIGLTCSTVATTPAAGTVVMISEYIVR